MILDYFRHNTTPAQRSIVELIANEFQRAGLPQGFAAAAIVNAYAESLWDPNAFNPELEASSPGRGSVGLFQLYDNGRGVGAGAGMSLPLINGQPDPNDPRRDPVKNTRRIIQETKSSFGQPLRDAYAQGADVAELTRLFAIHVERPANAQQKGAERAQRARQMFPDLVNVPAKDLDNALIQANTRIGLPLWAFPVVGTGLGLGVVALLLGVFGVFAGPNRSRRRRRRRRR